MKDPIELLLFLIVALLVLAGPLKLGLGWPPLLRLAVSLGLVDPNATDAEGRTRLLQAVGALLEPAQQVRLLLRAGADVNRQDALGATALHYALIPIATADQALIVRLLLDAGADPNAREAGGATPVHYATMLRDASLVEAVLSAGGQPNVTTPHGITPLMMAEDAQTVQALLGAGADLHARDEDGWSALDHALTCESPGSALALVAAGADVNAQDHDGQTPLARAVLAYAPGELIERLLEQGADPAARCDWGATAADLVGARWEPGASDRLRKRLTTPASATAHDVPGGDALHRAAVDGQLPPDLGGPVDRPSRGGRTALMLAAASPRADASTLQTLLAAGADPTAADAWGRTAVDYAVSYGDLPRLEVLLATGQERFEGERSPLHLATRDRDGDMVRALLRAGADAERPDTLGHAPVEVSLFNPDPSALAALLDAGVDPTQQATEHLHPLNLAARRASPEHVRLLLAAGARVDRPDSLGNYPLHDATHHPRGTGTLEALLAAKAPLEVKDAFGRTPLLIAAKHGTAAHVALLLQAGARRRYGSNLAPPGALSVWDEAKERPLDDPQRAAILALASGPPPAKPPSGLAG